MDKTLAFIEGIFAGLSSPASYSTPSRHRRRAGSDLMRMREDVLRVGLCFGVVLTRVQDGKSLAR